MSSYLFIDGAYLRKHFNEQMQTFYGVVPAIDFEALAASLKSERTYYYDAIDYERHATESDDTFQEKSHEPKGFTTTSTICRDSTSARVMFDDHQSDGIGSRRL